MGNQIIGRVSCGVLAVALIVAFGGYYDCMLTTKGYEELKPWMVDYVQRMYRALSRKPVWRSHRY